MRAASIALFCVFVVSSLTGAAAAQEGDLGSPEEALAQIREQTLYANYPEALAGALAYLERDDLGALQRNAGLETLATIHIAQRQSDEARTVLEQLYARDPGHRLSDADASPPVLSAFGRARSEPGTQVSIELSDLTEAASRRAPPHVQISVGEGLNAVAEVRLAYRQADGAFQTVVMSLAGSSADARVPLMESAAEYTMSYYVEARAPSGHVLATIGSASSPVNFVVPEAAPVPLGGSNGGETPIADDGGGDGVLIAIVVIVAALVAGGAVLTGFLVADASGPQDGSLGNIELPLLRF